MNEVAIKAIRESSIPAGTLAVWFGVSKDEILRIQTPEPVKPKKKPKPTHFMGWRIDD